MEGSRKRKVPPLDLRNSKITYYFKIIKTVEEVREEEHDLETRVTPQGADGDECDLGEGSDVPQGASTQVPRPLLDGDGRHDQEQVLSPKVLVGTQRLLILLLIRSPGLERRTHGKNTPVTRCHL